MLPIGDGESRRSLANVRRPRERKLIRRLATRGRPNGVGGARATCARVYSLCPSPRTPAPAPLPQPRPIPAGGAELNGDMAVFPAGLTLGPPAGPAGSVTSIGRSDFGRAGARGGGAFFSGAGAS